MRHFQAIEGRVLKLGDHIDTDLIYPGKYVALVDSGQWARHALEGIDPGFPGRIKPNDVIVAGRNFGCGSSRSQAVSCLKYAGIGAIVALSFSRIFFRNAINQGLPVIECPESNEALDEGQTIRINLQEGFIESQGRRLKFEPLPDFLLDIILEGGLVPFTRNLLTRQKGAEG